MKLIFCEGRYIAKLRIKNRLRITQFVRKVPGSVRDFYFFIDSDAHRAPSNTHIVQVPTVGESGKVPSIWQLHR
jgi:hypothetical protein